MTAAAITRRWGQDESSLVGVTSVVDELFDQDWSDREKLGELQSSEHVPLGCNKHLH